MNIAIWLARKYPASSSEFSLLHQQYEFFCISVKTNVSVLVEQFIKAINDVDYKTVEILANRLLSNIKLVGELLQGITSHSPKDVRYILLVAKNA